MASHFALSSGLMLGAWFATGNIHRSLQLQLGTAEITPPSEYDSIGLEVNVSGLTGWSCPLHMRHVGSSPGRPRDALALLLPGASKQAQGRNYAPLSREGRPIQARGDVQEDAARGPGPDGIPSAFAYDFWVEARRLDEIVSDPCLWAGSRALEISRHVPTP